LILAAVGAVIINVDSMNELIIVTLCIRIRFRARNRVIGCLATLTGECW